MQNLLLTKSFSGIALQSPFGAQGPFQGWSWDVPEDTVDLSVSEARLLEGHAAVAVTLHNSSTRQSRIILIDAATGKPGVDSAGGNESTV